MNIEFEDFFRSIEQQQKVKNEYIDFCAASLKNGKRITQSMTAKRIGADHSTISMWVNGKRNLSAKLLLAMVNYLEQEKGDETK